MKPKPNGSERVDTAIRPRLIEPRSEAMPRVLAGVLGHYLRFALATTRWRVSGERVVREVAANPKIVVGFWHECLPAVPVLWWRLRRLDPSRRAAILVSRHRDGRFIATVMRVFAFRAIHGSSGGKGRQKGGAPGMLAMMSALDAGDIVALTPDGPRGPRRTAAFGAAYLVARSGAGFVPIAARTAWRIRLRSWDRMEVPLPFGRGAACALPMMTGESVPVGAALDAAIERAESMLRRRPLLAVAWEGVARAGAPGWRVWLRRRAAQGREIASRLPEREGLEAGARPLGRWLWVHAASVGECVSVLPVVAELPDGVNVVMTSGTVTSATLVERRVVEMGLEARVVHRFAPLDVPGWVGRFLAHWRPEAACFVESEIWPNTLAACERDGVPVALVNARLSARSARRWGMAASFARHVLNQFAFVAAQSAADAARFSALGAPEVEVAGNLKLASPALPADEAELARLLSVLGDRPRWVAASTHPGDEAVVVAVHRALTAHFPSLVTAIVPRHPERGPGIAAECAACRRGAGQDPPETGGIWVADTLGELGLIYRLFPVVFMGKSFATGGGQNPLEPARLGCAVATGPATANFAEPVAALREAGGIEIVESPEALADFVARCWREPSLALRMGDAARGVAETASDLPARLAARLAGLMTG